MRYLVMLLGCLVVLGCGGGNGNGFIVGTPSLTSLTPNPAARGSNITLTGLNLNGTFTIATYTGLNGSSVQETATSGDTSSVVVPTPTAQQFTAGNYSVSVVTTDGFGDFSSASNSLSISLN